MIEGKTGDPVLDTDEAQTDFQATDIQGRFRYKNGISGKLTFEQVNEVTWKLTNAEMTTVPTAHGYWAGYRTTKAVAWVIEVAAGKWLARCGDKASGPSSLRVAKADALAMAKGAHGDYVIRNPIQHLNGLTARLLDAGAA